MTDTEFQQPPKKKSGGGAAIGAIVIFAIVALPVWFIFIGPSIRHDRLEKNGVRAGGRLLTVEETGTVVNDSPELELTVEFTRADGVLDTAVTDFIPSRRSLHMYQEGATVTAAYDREDPEELTILEIGGPATIMTVSQPGTTSAATDSLARLADSLRRELERVKSR